MFKASCPTTALLILLLGWSNGWATTFLQFGSTYLGDGWFQYQMQVMNDPFFTRADITDLTLNFTNEIDHSTTAENWTNSNIENPQSSWTFSQNIPARPYSEVFLVRSSETSYRLGTNGGGDGAMVFFSLYLAEFNPMTVDGDVSGNIVGYANFPCLVPCSPEQADDSPTNVSYALKLLPDVSIQQLLLSNGRVDGVDFLWAYDSTLLLQSSPDLATWTNIAYIWSYPPETLWTTNTPLDDFGKFFRLELIAADHTTNLPPLNKSVTQAHLTANRMNVPTPAPCVSGCQLMRGRIAVSLVTQANQNYTVSALDNHKVVQSIQPVAATGDSATIYFDAKSLPTPVFFQVTCTP